MKQTLINNETKPLIIHGVSVPKGTFCECKGYSGIMEDGICFKCDKPL